MEINGEYIKAVRESRGFKKADVVKATGLTNHEIKSIENGSARTLKSVIRLADFYGLTLGEAIKF